MMDVLRVGIVGANARRGWAHDAHIPALKRMPQFRLEAVSARTQELADEAKQAFGAAKAYGDSLALVRDPEIDIVDVTVRVAQHREIVLGALQAGKNVYCEWPLGRDVDEAAEMAAAVTPDTHAMIGLQALSSPAVRHAIKLVQDGALGELRVLRVFSPTAGWSSVAPPVYAYLQDKKNGATLATVAGGHTLAVIEHVVGPYAEIDARSTILQETVRITGLNEIVQRNCADHMFVIGHHQGGCVSTLEVTGDTPGRKFIFELVGSKGWLTLSSSHPGGFQVGSITLETSLEVAPAARHAIAGLVDAPVNVSESYLRLAADIAAGTRNVPDFAYAVRLTRLLDLIETASVTGQRQHVG